MKKIFAFIFAVLAVSASAKEIKVGEIVDIDGINYKITSVDPAQAEVTESPFAEGELEILSEFPHYGVQVKVVGIGKLAFYNGYFNGNIFGTLTIPEGMTYIDTQAFIGCYHLDSISLPSTLKNIGQAAFYCYNDKPSSLRAVRCAAVVPPACGEMVFGTRFNAQEGNDRDSIVLYVPVGSVEAYRAEKQWDYFNYIIDFEGQESSTVDEEHYDPDPDAEGGEGEGEQGIDDVQGAKVQSTKRVVNGVLYIERNGELYTTQGQKL